MPERRDPNSRDPDISRLSGFPSGAGEWLSGTGPESDIVISSRVRLARNVLGYPFIPKAETKDKVALADHLRERLQACKGFAEGGDSKLLYMDLDDLTAVDRLFLVERHLISKEHANAHGRRGVAITRNETVSIMVNEEDHLRVQVIRSGYQLDETLAMANRLDDELEARTDFAYNPQFGYLTACPTNVGTGMRASVMLHLPALVITKQIEKVFHAVSRVGLAVRGLYGEGTQASGDFYQISNQVTLGKAEMDLVAMIKGVVPNIIRYERTLRETMVTENRKELEDRVWRAFGVLRYARTINSEETMDLLSAVRMGVNLGLINDLEIRTVNELFIQTQPGHLQKLKGQALDSRERDVVRATLIRNTLE